MRKLFPILIRIFAVVVLLAIVAVVYSMCSGAPLIQRIDKTEPDINTASFEISTFTRIYYAQHAVKNADGSVTMERWYYRDDNKWNYQASKVTLPRVLRPVISRR